MPNERISQPDNPFDVRVAWGRDRDEVQVATVCESNPSGAERVVEIVNGWLENAGMPLVDWKALAQRIDNPPYYDGWHVTFSGRRAVNDLIRLLKRARDQAFGADA